MRIPELTLEQLQAYQPKQTRRRDFEEFWKNTMEEALSEPLEAEFLPMSYPVEAVRVFDVSFAGSQNTRIYGTYITAASPNTKGPGLAVFHGYGWHAMRVVHTLSWVMAGFSVLSLEVRGQDPRSPDRASYPNGHAAGWMTQGITKKESYYYRHVYTDCVRAVQLLAEREEVDPEKIAVTGMSQGGGLSLATAALHPRVSLCMPDLPFLCHFERAVQLAESGPYQEIARYLKTYDPPGHHRHELFATLSYFDCMNLAPWISCPLFVSVGLEDSTCPPSTVFAAFNHALSADRSMKIYPQWGHDEIPWHEEEKLAYALKVFS